MTIYQKLKLGFLYWLIAGFLVYGLQLGELQQHFEPDCRENRKHALQAAVIGFFVLPLFVSSVVFGSMGEGGLQWTCQPLPVQTLRKEC